MSSACRGKVLVLSQIRRPATGRGPGLSLQLQSHYFTVVPFAIGRTRPSTCASSIPCGPGQGATALTVTSGPPEHANLEVLVAMGIPTVY